MKEPTMKRVVRALKAPFRLEHVFAITVIIVALTVVLGWHKAIGLESDDVMIALLGILGIDMLVERVGLLRRIRSNSDYVREAMGRLENSARGFTTYELGMPALGSAFTTGREILMCGITLGRTLTSNVASMRQSAAAGARIRVAIIDPDPEAGVIEQSCRRSLVITSAEDLKRHLDVSVGSLKSIRLAGRNVELRKLSFVPPYSIIAVDADEPHGRIYIEWYCYKIKLDEAPALELVPSDGHWYQFFLRQVRSMLDGADELIPT